MDRHKPSWDRLETLVDACASRGASVLSHAQLRELAVLYRQTATDLSVVRDDPASPALARYLNALVGRAHNLIYAGGTPRARGILHFYARVFPRVFWQTFPYTLTAAAIFIAGLAGGSVMALADPGLERALLGGPMLDTIERGQMWTHSMLAIKPVASSAIMTNNLSVSFAAFAGGLTAGIGTVYMILLNGILLGVIAVACARAGMAVDFWSFVAPHGALELPAIVIAGGAGLLLAKGILVPGPQSRRDSLASAAALAVRLVLGVVPLLLVAGIIEGFVSPSGIPVSAKLAISAAGLCLLGSYLAWAGRGLEGAAFLDAEIAIDDGRGHLG